jgi:ATP-binding cassette, subfamily F, member 3
MARAAKDAASGKVRKEKQTAVAAPTPEPAKREDRKASGQARQKIAELTKPLRRELETLEKRIAALTTEKANIEAASARPDLTPAQRVEQGKRLKQIGDETEQAEGRWLELTTQIDALSAT